jgi:hypothetical protein
MAGWKPFHKKKLKCQFNKTKSNGNARFIPPRVVCAGGRLTQNLVFSAAKSKFIRKKSADQTQYPYSLGGWGGM